MDRVNPTSQITQMIEIMTEDHRLSRTLNQNAFVPSKQWRADLDGRSGGSALVIAGRRSGEDQHPWRTGCWPTVVKRRQIRGGFAHGRFAAGGGR